MEGILNNLRSFLGKKRKIFTEYTSIGMPRIPLCCHPISNTTYPGKADYTMLLQLKEYIAMNGRRKIIIPCFMFSNEIAIVSKHGSHPTNKQLNGQGDRFRRLCPGKSLQAEVEEGLYVIEALKQMHIYMGDYQKSLWLFP